jgi:hypothetical protein
MSIKFDRLTGSKKFRFKQLSPSVSLAGFACPVDEYNIYLYKDALRSQHDHVALTWLLREHLTVEIAAYMTLIADGIKLSIAEKELHNLSCHFETIPAIKTTKLAASQTHHERYSGIGSFMIDSAELLALDCNRNYCACRFLTVDADIDAKFSSFDKYVCIGRIGEAYVFSHEGLVRIFSIKINWINEINFFSCPINAVDFIETDGILCMYSAHRYVDNEK